MDQDYFAGYQDGIEDCQKEAAKLRPLARVGIGALGGLAGVGAASIIRSIPQSHREVATAVAKAKKAAGKKWLTMKPIEQSRLMLQYMPGAKRR